MRPLAAVALAAVASRRGLLRASVGAPQHQSRRARRSARGGGESSAAGADAGGGDGSGGRGGGVGGGRRARAPASDRCAVMRQWVACEKNGWLGARARKRGGGCTWASGHPNRSRCRRR